MTISIRYTVIRVVPDPVRDEPVNVGVVLQNPEDGETRVRVIGDVEKLRRSTGEDIDPSAIDFALGAIEEAARARHPGPEFLSYLASQYTHVIQFSVPAGSLANDLPSELNLLYRPVREPRPKGKASEIQHDATEPHKSSSGSFRGAGRSGELSQEAGRATWELRLRFPA